MSRITLLLLLVAFNCVLAWREVSKSCPAGCESVGNCNREFGICECPFGRTGPACEQHLLSACRTSGDPKALPFYGFAHPKSCACWRQLAAVGFNFNRSALYLESIKGLLGGAVKYCYARKGISDEHQWSDPPKVTDPDVIWHCPVVVGKNVELLPPQNMPATPTELKLLLSRDRQSGPKALPLDLCTERCNERGSCAEGHCQCMQGFAGPSCSQPEPLGLGCMNKCGGIGKCIGGFCHCPPTHWGMDCTRSKAYEPDPAVPGEVEGKAYSRTALRIYRYEMPWSIAFPFAGDDTAFGYNRLYSAFEEFFDQFAPDNVTRTENPHEANLFYVPLLDFFKDDNAGDVYEFTRRAVLWLKETYPQFWGRNQGRDHFFWLPGDLGACWLLDEPEVQNPIKIVHWGLQINASEYTHMPHYWWVKDHPVNKEYHCFKAEKDVCTPCWVDDKAKEMTHADVVYKEALAGQQRRYLLFFGGGIRHGQMEYSGGARQAFDKHVLSKKHPEVLFGGGRDAYKEATFCLAPYGDGWGSRLPHIMQAACIPVIVQEYVHQPFDDVLRYEEFSIRLQVSDMPNLLETLQGVTPEQIQRYREKMFEVHKAFHWIAPLGGQAYNYTLRSLHRKLINLWGEHTD